MRDLVGAPIGRPRAGNARPYKPQPADPFRTGNIKTLNICNFDKIWYNIVKQVKIKYIERHCRIGGAFRLNITGDDKSV